MEIVKKIEDEKSQKTTPRIMESSTERAIKNSKFLSKMNKNMSRSNSKFKLESNFSTYKDE
jgi:hypothetical protein